MSTRLKFLSTIPILACMLLLLIDSSTFMSAFSTGINTWAVCVLPAILPFMVLSRLLSSIDYTSSRQRQILHLPYGSIRIITLSMVSGYPMGAKLLSQNYNNGTMSSNNCIKTSILASTASPIFIIATIGNRLLVNSMYAWIIIIAHILGAIVNYLIHYNRYNDNSIQPSKACNSTNSDIMLDSLLSVLLVGGYIALFSVLCQMILYILPPWFSNDGYLLTSYVLGLLEMTTGCINICSVASSSTSAILCCSLLSFGGLCITMQCMQFLKPCKIKYSTVLAIKATHCAISTIICYILISLC